MSGYAHLKWYNQILETFDVYLQANNQLYLSLFPLRYCKDIAQCYLGTLPGHTHPKWYYQIVENLCLSAEKKSASSNDSSSSSETVDSFISFIKWHLNFRYCSCFEQDVPWLSGNWRLQIHSKRVCDTIKHTISFNPPHFSGDIPKIYKLLILSTLGMPGYTHPKWYYQLVENFNVYMHAKNKIHHSFFSWDIKFERILQFDCLKWIWPITQEPEFCQIHIRLAVKCQWQCQFSFWIIFRKN